MWQIANTLSGVSYSSVSYGKVSRGSVSYGKVSCGSVSYGKVSHGRVLYVRVYMTASYGELKHFVRGGIWQAENT